MPATAGGSAPAVDARRSRIAGFLAHHRSLRGWQVALIALVGLLIGTGIGAASTSDDEVKRLEAELAESRSANAALRSDISGLESEVDDAKADAESAESRARRDAQSSIRDKQRALDRREKTLNQRERDLETREAAVGIRETEIENASFGDGLWEVGVDIQPGKYKTQGSSNCYWAKLASSDTSDIRDNNFAPGPQTVVIDSPYFESQDCGTWVPAP